MQSRTSFRSARLGIGLATIACAFGLATGAAAQTAAAKDAKDDMWEVTTKMDMPGMQMPAQTNRVCLAKGQKEEGYIPRRDGCKVTESNRAGPKFTYKMVCTGKEPMTVNGEITTGPKSYEGRMNMAMKHEGQDMNVTQTFSGKLVGECASSK
jgi:hypothetical protein